MRNVRNKQEEQRLRVAINIYCGLELKELAENAADMDRVPLSEWIIRAMADALKRPDLRVVPRKPAGRPRGSGRGRKISVAPTIG